MPKRRTAGEGTLRQRSDGRWEFRVTVGFDFRGRQVRRSFYGKTAGEAVDEAQAARATLPDDLDSDRMTLAAYLARWIEYRESPPGGDALKAHTLHSYRTSIDRYINPRIGGVPLKKLRPLHIEALLSELAARGLSANTVRIVRATLSSALGQAVRWRLIQVSPVQAVRTRRGKKHSPQASWSSEEVVRFLEEARSHRLFALFYLALTTGARLGELLALRLEDLDLEGGVLQIRRSYAYIPKQGLVLQEPKTERSRRALRLPADAIEILGEHVERVAKERSDARELWQEQRLLFPSTIGKPIFPRNLVRAFETIRDRCAVRPITFHGLRHTWATLALRSGAFLPDVSARLGHYDPAFTLSTYIHALEDSPPEALSIAELTATARQEDEVEEEAGETVN